jgi:hypothetical protein
MNTDMILTIIGLVFIGVITAAVCFHSYKKSGDKQEALDFLEGLANELKNMIIEFISSITIDDLKDLDNVDIKEIEQYILNNIYEITCDYVKKTVQNNIDTNKDFFTRAVLAFLENREFVENFIRELITNKGINMIINEKSSQLSFETVKERSLKMVEEDNNLQEEFSDQEKYIEESTDDDLTHGEMVNEPTEEELNKLNPQVDEEEELDPENDPSVEVIDDDIYYDKSGRPRSKKTGKWVKVNK